MAAMDEKGNGGACLVMPGTNPNDIAAALLLLCADLQHKCSALKEQAISASCECSRLRKEVAELKGLLSSFRQQSEERPGDLN